MLEHISRGQFPVDKQHRVESAIFLHVLNVKYVHIYIFTYVYIYNYIFTLILLFTVKVSGLSASKRLIQGAFAKSKRSDRMPASDVV